MNDASQLRTFDDLSDSFLLSGPSNFDDGVCAESTYNTMGRNGPINCQSRFTIPAGTAPGIYALYWVWDFPKLTAIDPSYVEMYTSCMDVEVVAGGTTSPPPALPPAKTHRSIAKSTKSGKVANPVVVVTTIH